MTSGRPLRPGVGLLLLLWVLLRGSEQRCPAVCMCTADTLSCASSGLSRLPRWMPASPLTVDLGYNHLTWLGPRSFSGMPRLENLRLARNRLASLGRDALLNATGLRHLDLSSNRLRTVEEYYFQGLWRLEELLLFDNRIARVDAAALVGLSSLTKAYFSLNRITDFPFFSIQENSHPFLTTLDLSSNWLSALPWDEVRALPGSVQRGLFLHNNSLLCDCPLHDVFRHWERKGFDSLKDFREEHVCTMGRDSRSTIHFLRQTRVFQNCTVSKTLSLPVTALLSNLVVLEGERLRLDCHTSLQRVSHRDPSFVWLTPSQGNASPATAAANDDTNLISVFANGTLEIVAARVNDSGLYVCVAADPEQMRNATREVNVTVAARPPADSFNTGYTTLLGCAIATVLILMYLYLTPCECGCCKPPGTLAVPVPGGGGGGGSVYRPAASPCCGQGDGAAVGLCRGRCVAILEPLVAEPSQNERLKANEQQLPAQWCWGKTGVYETAFLDTVIKI